MCIQSLRKLELDSCPMFVCSCLLCLCNWFPQSASELVAVFFQKSHTGLQKCRILHTYVSVSWDPPPPPHLPPPPALWNTGKLNFPSGESRTSSIFGDEVLGKCSFATGGGRGVSPEASSAPQPLGELQGERLTLDMSEHIGTHPLMQHTERLRT